MHFCRPRRKHVQSFKKTGLKLYEKLQSQGTYGLYIWAQKMTMFKNMGHNTHLSQLLQVNPVIYLSFPISLSSFKTMA